MPTKNLLVLPYDERFSSISSLVQKFQINVVFSNNCTVKNIMIKNSPSEVTGCIYQIPCKECDKYYIGETGKGLEVRKKQHMYSIRSGQQSNALFAHVSEYNHPIDWNNAKVVIKCKDRYARNIIESSLIKFQKDQLLNNSLGMFKLDSFIVEKVVHNILHTT